METDFGALPLIALAVVETECHDGDLPAYFDGVQTQTDATP
jgi:hypothetical protein